MNRYNEWFRVIYGFRIVFSIKCTPQKKVRILKKDQLFNDVQHGYYIIGERDKNGQPTIIPLFKFPYAATILDRYRDTGGEHDFLFRRKVFIEVQVYNRNLKLLGKMAGIPRRISNKTGRHTNAQMWIRFGAERPVLSRMLGHECQCLK